MWCGLIRVSVFVQVNTRVFYLYDFAIQLEIRMVYLATIFVVAVQVYFGYHRILCLHINFVIISIYINKRHGLLLGIALSLQITLDRLNIFNTKSHNP